MKNNIIELIREKIKKIEIKLTHEGYIDGW